MDNEQHKMSEEMIQQGIKLFLHGLGLDLTDQHLIRTPERVAKAWVNEFGRGYSFTERDIKKILSVDFADDFDEMIVVKNISFNSHCIHHMVQFSGTAKIGYVPNKRVVGLSKLPRILDVYAARLQIQERLTRQVASAIYKYVQPKGVGVVIEAVHNCVACRGVGKPGSRMITSSLLGEMRDNKAMREEFLTF